MAEFAKNYYEDIINFINSIRVTDNKGKELNFYNTVEEVGNQIISLIGSGSKVIFIGNGASAAISSHMSVDYWKNGGVRAIAFNDSSLLTCIGNDYGYNHVFQKPIEMFANNGDILVAISSSGRSENILLAVQAALVKNCKIITLSGFDSDNPLSMLGTFNFYVPAQSYGPVEIIHHSICHCILDTMIKKAME